MAVSDDEGEFLLTRLEHIFYQPEERDGTHKRDAKTTVMPMTVNARPKRQTENRLEAQQRTFPTTQQANANLP